MIIFYCQYQYYFNNFHEVTFRHLYDKYQICYILPNGHRDLIKKKQKKNSKVTSFTVVYCGNTPQLASFLCQHECQSSPSRMILDHLQLLLPHGSVDRIHDLHGEGHLPGRAGQGPRRRRPRQSLGTLILTEKVRSLLTFTLQNQL